jgi:hypothetical protein
MVSCGDSSSDPQPALGIITGKITPANSITNVTATNEAKKTFTVTPSPLGEYSLGGLTAGTYTLSFTPANDYASPTDEQVVVKAGETVKAADITVKKSGGQGEWKVNPATTATSATFVLATFQFGDLAIAMTNATAGQSVVFNLSDFTGNTGTFTAGGFSQSQFMFSQNSGNTGNQWSANFLGGTATVTVTSVKSNPRRVSGSFTGKLTPATSAATGTKEITGTFTDLLY